MYIHIAVDCWVSYYTAISCYTPIWDDPTLLIDLAMSLKVFISHDPTKTGFVNRF